MVNNSENMGTKDSSTQTYPTSFDLKSKLESVYGRRNKALVIKLKALRMSFSINTVLFVIVVHLKIKFKLVVIGK